MNPSGNIYKSAGAVIRRRRKAVQPQAMKQETLARAVRLTRTSISNIELGRQKITLDTFCEIARMLEVPPAELLSEALNESATTTTTTSLPASGTSDDPLEEYLIEEIIKQGGSNGN